MLLSSSFTILTNLMNVCLLKCMYFFVFKVKEDDQIFTKKK